MEKIAIQGHPTRGKDVIKILESLGGNNYSCLEGKNTNGFYWVSTSNYNIGCNFPSCVPKGYKYYTLEEYEQKFNNMEKRNIQIDLITAKEWYNKGGDLRKIALQAFSENELKSLPTSWEEYCEINPRLNANKAIFLLADGHINHLSVTAYYARKEFPGALPSKERAEQFLTLNKLLQIRDYYNRGWKPNWNNRDEEKHAITTHKNELYRLTSYLSNYLFTFKTKELRDEFFNNFKEDLEFIREFL